jgi:hypothetical protein
MHAALANGTIWLHLDLLPAFSGCELPAALGAQKTLFPRHSPAVSLDIFSIASRTSTGLSR